MTTIYLIRHAEAEGNLYRVAQGQHESNLTDRGWRQVRALERRFADVPVDAVYASDLYRTRATATAIYRPKNLPLHRCPGLREIRVGDWEGRTWGDIARGTPQAMADFGSRMDRWSIPGAETPAQVLERVRRTVEDIARENPGRTLALFSHGYAIRLLLANLQGISLRDTGARSPTGDNTAVSLLEWDGEGLRVVFANDNSHLKTPEYLAGEKPARPKRAFALEPGLWFRPLGRGEARERLAAWAEASPFPEAPLTLEGFLEEESVGLLQLDPERGRIGLLHVRPEYRKRGFGTQFIGQAVLRARGEGVEVLSVLLPPESPERAFFLDCGFAPGEEAEGGTLWRKSIGFDPAI
ncbi:GNAT family N-acetyltransferase [uncultured Oscillibacter sp.]|uniref:GNAT family N-acetyltransferase n=1 Tax=uncultured Oscillibacter sp. TaxID=876091 RepID=UPI0026257E09|nr:GNAT family N-acetyltransferase [uncultured Oscillibacter sp.]